MKRVQCIDVLRGLVMIIMALDHTRDFLHVSSITQSPTDLATTTPALFFTRWITHLCAPTFIFLSGSSAYLSFKNKNNLAASRRFLVTRGLWLIVLEFTLVNFGVWFDVHFSVLFLNVLSAIGIGFIALGLFLKASSKTILITGLLVIFLHNLFTVFPLPESSVLRQLLTPLFVTQAFPLTKTITFVVGYPPIPWLGIMLAGFGAGGLFTLAVNERRKAFLKIGLLSLLMFLFIRAINIYGDPAPWAEQKTILYTFLSFINVTKYPPSLSFCLLMLGIMFLLLFFIDGIQNRLTDFMMVYGKVPLFYFVIHWYIIHPLMFLVVYLQGYTSDDLVFGFNFGRPAGSGVGLWAVYLIWLLAVIILYPVCKSYGKYKELNRETKWLRYL